MNSLLDSELCVRVALTLGHFVWQGTPRLEYAASLLRVAELSRVAPAPAPAAMFSLLATDPEPQPKHQQKPSKLRQHIARLLGETSEPQVRVRPTSFLALIGVLLAGSIFATRFALTEESPPAPASPSAETDQAAGVGDRRRAQAIRVLLKLNRREFLLGESIAVEYEMTNDGNEDAPYGKGGFYPDLRINDGFRMSAVEVDENGKPVAEPVANWPMPQNFGGPVGGFQLKPGEKYSTTLFVTRYLRFVEPGRYRLRVENVNRLEEPPKTAYSMGEMFLTLKQPTLKEARGVFERMKKASRQAWDDNAMKFLPDAADFQAMHQLVYLPVLKEYAAKSDLDALQSLERMERVEANDVLVAAMACALDHNDWQTARACFQHLKVCLPFPNWYIEPLNDYDKPNRDRVARTWKADFGPMLTRLARRLNVEVTAQMKVRESEPRDADAKDREFMKVFRNGYFPNEHPQSLLKDIDLIYRCVGQPDDFADCLTAFAHSIELTKSLPLETQQYFRPRGSAYGFRHTVMYLLQRGAKGPTKPTHPGEAAAFAIALRLQASFRPEGWQAELMKWLKHDSPYLAEMILDYLPDAIPNDVFDYLPIALAHDYIDLQIAACHVAKKHPLPAYRESLQKILDTAKDEYLRKYAVDAARANGLKAKYDPNAPFVDPSAEDSESPQKSEAPEGLPKSGDGQSTTDNTNGDLRSRQAAGPGDPRRAQNQAVPPTGLEFLASYPKLSGLSLDMTEPQFRAFAAKGKLTLQMTPRDGAQSSYSIPTGDGHTVVVMFQKGKCSGIQRIRGEDRVDKVSFESVAVTFKAPLGRKQPEQIQIKADGSCVYHIDEQPARGQSEKRPEARLTCQISTQRMLELERLLAKTDWLTAEGGAGPARHTDAEETTITVVRNKDTKTITCLGTRPEPYHSLLWLLRGIAEQEHLVYVIDWRPGSETDRKLALIKVRFEVEALEGRPGRALPYLELDYNRFLPTFTRMVRNPSTVEDEVLTAIKLVTFVRAESEIEAIAKLKHDREWNVRNTVATALADFGSERVLPTLVEMAPDTPEARWGLIRLGEIAVPSLVKLIEPNVTSNDHTSEHIVRAFLDHRNELPGPIDNRIVTTVRQALAKTSERQERTEYFKEFLDLVDQQRGVHSPRSSRTGKVETAPADATLMFRGVKLTDKLRVNDRAVLHDLQIAFKNDAIRTQGGTPRDISQTEVTHKTARDKTGREFVLFRDAKRKLIYVLVSHYQTGKPPELTWYGPLGDDDARRVSPDPARDATKGPPTPGEGQSKADNTNADQGYNPAAGSGDPRRPRPNEITDGNANIESPKADFAKEPAESDAPRPTGSNFKRDVLPLIKLLDSKDNQKRGEAIVALGAMKEKAGPAAQQLVEQLGETKVWVTVGRYGSAIAGHAERSLLSIGTRAVPALIDGLKHDKLEVRRRSAQVLGQLKDARAVNPLIELLGNPDRELVNHATTALGHIGAPAVEPLLNNLASGDNQERQQAAGALGLTKDARAIEPLVAALHDDDELSRLWAAHAISNNLTDASKKILARPENSQQLIAALKTDSRELRGQLSTVLYHLRLTIPDALIAVLDDPDPRVREGISLAVGDMNDERAVKPLLKIAAGTKNKRDRDDGVIRAAAITGLSNSLGLFETPDDVLTAVLPALSDPLPRIRTAAASALSRIAERWPDDKRAVEPLLAALRAEGDQDVLQHIVLALAGYRDTRTVESLLAFLERAETFRFRGDTPRDQLTPADVRAGDDNLHDQAAVALAKIGDVRAIPALRKLLPRQRPQILEALGELHDRESVLQFIAAVNPPKPWTENRITLAASAARALAQTPDERALPTLIEALARVSIVVDRHRDPYGNLRHALCEALAASGDPRAVDALLNFARSWHVDDGWVFDQSPRDEPDDGDRSGHPAAWPLSQMGLVALPRLIEELQAMPAGVPGGENFVSRESQSGREVAAWVLANMFGKGNWMSPEDWFSPLEPLELLSLTGEVPPAEGQSAVTVLIAALQDRSPLVRQFSARALGNLKAKQAVPELIKLVDEPRHPSDVIPPMQPGVSPEWDQSRRKQWDARTVHLLAAVARALSMIGDERGAIAAAKLLKQPAPKVRTAAIYAVLSTKHPQAVELVLPQLAESDEVVRDTAARQLGFTKDPRSVASLIYRLRTEQSPSIRATIAQSLGLLGDRSASDALAESATDSDRTIRLKAAVALLQLNDDRGFEPFRTLLMEGPTEERVQHLQHLSLIAIFTAQSDRPKLEHAAARELLVRVVTTDRNVRVRASGVEALRGLSDKATIEALLTLMNDSSEWVRSDALGVFADTTDPRRIDVLHNALKDRHPLVRSYAAAKLGIIHSEQSASSLISALDDKDESVRDAALGALSELKATSALPAIEEVIRADSSSHVRLRAKNVAQRLRNLP